MTGSVDILVKNTRIQYKFTINRNITILKGDSATGKTTLIDMIESFQQVGADSGVEIHCSKKCVVISTYEWEMNLQRITDSIVFIDEGGTFVKSKEFAKAIQNTDNYYVLATRAFIPTLPYSIKEVYGIKNTASNQYQQTTRLYSEFYPIYGRSMLLQKIEPPDLVIVEDSHSGYDFFKGVCSEFSIDCISAEGKSNVFNKAYENRRKSILLIADGAAFGSEIENILKLRQNQQITIYLPESFEWMILKSGLIKDVREIIDNPQDYIESKDYFSWERFFTALLIAQTEGSYLQYTKRSLNKVYLQPHEKQQILNVMPELDWNK